MFLWIYISSEVYFPLSLYYFLDAVSFTGEYDSHGAPFAFMLQPLVADTV